MNNTKKLHKSDNLYLNLAYEIAQKSDMQHKHGCIIIDNKGNIISSGYNKFLFVPADKIKIFKKDTTLKISNHAEEMALKSVDPRKLYKAKLYIVRINLTNQSSNNNNIHNFSYSKPCKRCTSIINTCMKRFGLKCVYYT